MELLALHAQGVGGRICDAGVDGALRGVLGICAGIEGGDAFTFLMKVENLTFAEAVKTRKPAGGGRFHFTENVALTLRAGYPDVAVGISFLL